MSKKSLKTRLNDVCADISVTLLKKSPLRLVLKQTGLRATDEIEYRALIDIFLVHSWDRDKITVYGSH